MPRRSVPLIAAVLAIVLGAAGAMAQTSPVAPGGLTPPRPSEKALPLPAFPAPETAPPLMLPPVPPAADKALSAGPRFILKGVRFTGNRAVADEDLAKLAAALIGTPVATEDLSALRRALTRLYISRGYINSGAVLPDQDVSAGIVRFHIIEGGLDEIAVSGNTHLDADYVSGRLARAAGPPLHVGDLQEQVQILLQDPLIARIDARLLPGARPGEAKLAVNIAEAPRFAYGLSAANNRAPSIGAEGVSGQVEIRNLTGRGEHTTLRHDRTEGLHESEAALSVPLSYWNTRLSLRVLDGASEVVTAPFNAIDVESESRDYEIALTQPVWRTVGGEIALGLEFARRESETFLLGRPFTFSPGPRDGRSVVSAARFVQSLTLRDQTQVIAARSTFSRGLDLLGATINGGGVPDGRFTAWLGQAQWARRLPWITLLQGTSALAVLRGDAQLSFDRLLPLEKFSIGGAGSVRGYRENQLVRDNGWVASLELRLPVARAPLDLPGAGPGDGVVEIAPFFDFGRGWDSDIATVGPRTIYSVGAGLRWSLTSKLFASLYYGHALRDVENSGDSDIQDSGVHFRLTAAFPLTR